MGIDLWLGIPCSIIVLAHVQSMLWITDYRYYGLPTFQCNVSCRTMATSKTTNTYNRQNWEDAVSKQPLAILRKYTEYDMTV